MEILQIIAELDVSLPLVSVPEKNLLAVGFNGVERLATPAVVAQRMDIAELLQAPVQHQAANKATEDVMQSELRQSMDREGIKDPPQLYPTRYKYFDSC